MLLDSEFRITVRTYRERLVSSGEMPACSAIMKQDHKHLVPAHVNDPALRSTDKVCRDQVPNDDGRSVVKRRSVFLQCVSAGNSSIFPSILHIERVTFRLPEPKQMLLNCHYRSVPRFHTLPQATLIASASVDPKLPIK